MEDCFVRGAKSADRGRGLWRGEAIVISTIRCRGKRGMWNRNVKSCSRNKNRRRELCWNPKQKQYSEADEECVLTELEGEQSYEEARHCV